MDATPHAPSLLETIEQLDLTDNAEALIQLAQDETLNTDELIYAVYHLLGKTRLRSAYILASFLVVREIQNPFLSIALAAGGLEFRNPEHLAFALANLAPQADAMLTAQPAVYDHIQKTVVDPILTHLLAQALMQKDNAQILRILEMLKAYTPRFRAMFDWDAPVPEFSLAAMRRRGEEQKSHMLRYPQPPAGVPRQQRRVLVVLREYIFPNKSWSRPFDIGPRTLSAMNAYGWQTHFFPLKGEDMIAEANAIVELVRQEQFELLVLDDDIMLKVMPLRVDLLARLQGIHPSLKIISCLLDAWELDPDLLRVCIAAVDGVWTMDAPSRPIWQEPGIAGKVIQLPFPFLEENYLPPGAPLTGEPQFFGSISGYNWHRAFWIPAFEQARLPVKSIVATHETDGLSALASFSIYMRALANATCCINLSMRANQHCTVTGRSFETMFSGALLLQETSSDMYRYFIPGEHYLEFATLPELAAIIRFIQEHPEEAEAVRQRGNAFIHEHYSDEKIIGAFDKLLFFPD
ncbi:MAG: glycosyltransferase [Magnetococcus sp. YQC-3]